MRYFCYNEPVFDEVGRLVGNEVITVSEDDIRRDYYPYWLERVTKKYGPNHPYTFADCVDDYVIGNWAWESSNDDGRSDQVRESL